MKITRKQLVVWLSALLVIVCVSMLVVFLRPFGFFGRNDKAATIETRAPKPPAHQTPTPVPQPAGTPRLDRLELVTDQAFGNDGEYVPNGWGMHKTRIVRTSTGDIFTVFTSQGSDNNNREWHLMHRAPDGGGWKEIKNGDAGVEPINILLAPNDVIHLFTWPGTKGILQHLSSDDLGKTWTSDTISGDWLVDQGYAGAAVNGQGDIVVFQTGEDQPGRFLWSYYTPETNQWKFHSTQIDYRYTYAFFFPGDNHDLTITGMRDVRRQTLGYTASSDFDYVFDEIKYFYIKDVYNPQITQVAVKKVPPQNDSDYDLTYETDSYMDTQGRTHILYSNMYDGPHHAIIQDGRVVKDVRMDVGAANKMRITQDAAGRFYIISVDDQGHLNVYPGAANDTDGTQLDPVVPLDISRYPGCTNDDYCLAPTFTVPRSGNPRTNYIDGIYGNFQQVIYFRVNLRGTNEGK